MAFAIKFWGVRGSIAVPSSKHIRYGGNTSCVQVFVGDRQFILDAGTGIRNLGREVLKTGTRRVDLLLSHTHWDHITGFPFFVPAYKRDWTVRILAGHLYPHSSIKDVLSTQMDHPMFPVPLEAMRSDLVIEDFQSGDSFQLYDDVKVRTGPLNHPNRAVGYRIEHAGKSVCYVTDTEHVPGQLDQNILALVEGADVVMYDSTYTEEEFPSKIGWGHSTWNEGVKLCREAGVKKFILFHHEPDHDDAFMDKLEAEAKAAWDVCTAAREGMVVEI